MSSDDVQELDLELSELTERSRDLVPHILSLDDLRARDIPPREYLFGEWMPKDSFGMVYAARGVGKSWFAMDMAAAIADGRQTFLGWEVKKDGPVLYVDGEMALVDLRDRLDAISPVRRDNFLILASEDLYRSGRPLAIDELSEQEAIDNALNHLSAIGKRPGLIILDNLSTLRRGMNENDNSETQSLIDWAVHLRHQGYAVFFVHHAGKSGTQRGASILEVPMDYVIKLEDPRKKNGKKESVVFSGACFDLSFDKCRGREPEPREFRVKLIASRDGTLRLVNDGEKMALEAKHHFLMMKQLYPDHGYSRIAQIIGVSKGSLTNYRKALVFDGLINPGQHWKVTDKGFRLLADMFPQNFSNPDIDQTDDLPF